jgi:hypothetical protein
LGPLEGSSNTLDTTATAAITQRNVSFELVQFQPDRLPSAESYTVDSSAAKIGLKPCDSAAAFELSARRVVLE